MSDPVEMGKLGVAVLALLLCIFVVWGVLKLAQRDVKKDDSGNGGNGNGYGNGINGIKTTIDSGRIIVATLEQYRSPFPDHWEEKVESVAKDAAAAFFRDLEVKGVPIPEHWLKLLRKDREAEMQDILKVIAKGQTSIELLLKDLIEKRGKD